MGGYGLRPYQEEAVEAVLGEWEAGRRKTLLVLPTGCGKTICFAEVARRQAEKGRRVLVLAHRGELLRQAADKIQRAARLPCAIEAAGSSSLGSLCPVTVGSVQSMSRDGRLAEFPPDYFQDVVVDEAHHCLSESYQKVLGRFGGANVLGVTATPDRGDQRGLGEYFDSKAYEYDMARAVREGYLCPVRAEMIPLKIDISSVATSGGDYSAGGAGAALEPYLEQIAGEMAARCAGRRTVAFLPLIETSRKLCAMLNARGLRAAEVNGASADREQVLSDFEAGRYDALCNSMLLTEGWDCPSVDCIAVLRPTKVRSLYQQMVGRGMRLCEGKDGLLLLDFLWLTERHDLCRPSALVGRSAELAARVDGIVEAAGGPVDLGEAEERAERDAVAEREAALARELAAQRRKKARLVDPVQYCYSIADEDLAGYAPSFAWEMEPPTEKQKKMLEKWGINAEAVETRGMASLLADRLARRRDAGMATPRQIRCLERYGFRNVGRWAFDDASKMISRLAANKWAVPRGVAPGEYDPAAKGQAPGEGEA